jgi:hypothetical protein
MEDSMLNQTVDKQLAETNIMRHLPQLRRLHGTPGHSSITNLCYLAQSHLESAWQPQNREKAILFFQMAQIHISEMLKHTVCKDVTDIMKTIRSRIAAMEFLVKTVESKASAHNYNWRHALDPIVQMFKAARKQCQDAADDMETECSTCVEDSSDNESIIESLKPTLVFWKAADTNMNTVKCINLLEEPVYKPEYETIPDHSSPSTCYSIENLNMTEVTFKIRDSLISPSDGTEGYSDEDEDMDHNEDDSSSEYMPMDDSLSQTSMDYETADYRKSPVSDIINSTIPSSTPSDNDLESALDNSDQSSKYNAQTLHYLETMFYEVYSCRDKLNKSERNLIQQQTGLPPRSITYWFANHKRRYQKELQKYRRSKAASYAEYLAIISKNNPHSKGRVQLKKMV